MLNLFQYLDYKQCCEAKKVDSETCLSADWQVYNDERYDLKMWKVDGLKILRIKKPHTFS